MASQEEKVRWAKQVSKANLASVASQVREVLLVQPGPKVPRVQRASPESKVSLGCKAKEG
jgi:hypothetical protein